jgi:hypothetical protein
VGVKNPPQFNPRILFARAVLILVPILNVPKDCEFPPDCILIKSIVF